MGDGVVTEELFWAVGATMRERRSGVRAFCRALSAAVRLLGDSVVGGVSGWARLATPTARAVVGSEQVGVVAAQLVHIGIIEKMMIG